MLTGMCVPAVGPQLSGGRRRTRVTGAGGVSTPSPSPPLWPSSPRSTVGANRKPGVPGGVPIAGMCPQVVLEGFGALGGKWWGRSVWKPVVAWNLLAYP